MDAPLPEPASAGKSYLNIAELSSRSGLSVTTLRRLILHGKIEAFQPGGPGTKWLFPPDTLEHPPVSTTAADHPAAERRKLPGRRPAWMAAASNSDQPIPSKDL